MLRHACWSVEPPTGLYLSAIVEALAAQKLEQRKNEVLVEVFGDGWRQVILSHDARAWAASKAG